MPISDCLWFLASAPIDWMPLPSSEKLNFDAAKRAELMLKLHETTKENIEHMNVLTQNFRAMLRAHEQARRARSMELEIHLASA